MLYSFVVRTEASVEVVAVNASNEEEAQQRAEELLPPMSRAGESQRVVRHLNGACVHRIPLADAQVGASAAQPAQSPQRWVDPFLR